MKFYGEELILDLHGCDVTKFDRHHLTIFFRELCKLIDMIPEDLHFWDNEDTPEEERRTEPHIEGISAVQFILTSNITIHTLVQLKTVYINIFSCKEFESVPATDFCIEFFSAKICHSNLVKRNWPDENL